MTGGRILVAAVVVGATLLAAPRPAQARFDIGLGTILGRSGVSTGVNYRFGGWFDRLGSYVHWDASRYVNKKRKKKDPRREEQVRKEGGSGNVDLKVAPDDVAILLNGRLVNMEGRGDLMLPPGKHRLEFVRPGYRTEMAELNVQGGVDYTVERKLSKLGKGEQGDARLEKSMKAATVYEVLRATEDEWDVTRKSAEARKQESSEAAPAGN
jgi:hypothetical protein